MSAFLEYAELYQREVDDALHGYMQSPVFPELLRQSMSYSLFAGGKRLRPYMTLAACDMLQGDRQAALPFACALEMIHSYSLIHDDLPAMDDDDFRRGKPSNHKVFGEGQAILAGDGLLSYAFEIIMDAIIKTPLPQFIHAGAVIAKGAGVFGMVKGQCLDLQQEGKTEGGEALLLAIHEGKTAAMLIAAVEAGGYCANASKAEIAALRAFGKAYGLLFQITDDILDVEGNAACLGKTTGKDAKAGKYTFASQYGLERAKQYALQTAQDARDALTSFKDGADFFYALIDYTLQRKS